MSAGCPTPFGFEDNTDWRKDRKLARSGFRDLEYLPRGRSGWNATLAAYAYWARRQLAGPPDLNLWAAMHGVAASARYEQLGQDGLVLWHGTSAVRAEKIREVGLFHKGGVWAAVEPVIAHSFTRGRSRAFRAGSAMVVLLIRKSEWDGRADPEGPSIVRFHESVPRECVEYILWSDRIEFVGAQHARPPKPWGVARFKKRQGRWVPRSRPPVRLDQEHTYSDLEGWLELSIRRILKALGSAAAVEVFSSLYATIDPWEALEHRRIFAALERLCGPGRQARGGVRRLSLRDE
ncbi:MAG TPA: hypothetical protein VM389_02970 [Phycisphaerae bacterium]|nr:hypothetical protein [Phycisphaerae bacterium]